MLLTKGRIVIRARTLRTFLVFAVGAAAVGVAPRLPATAAQRGTATFNLDEVSITTLQQRMQNGQETARSLAEKYLARIQTLDRQGPSLHSVIERNPDALTIADAVDAERRTRGPRGPLHGIPVLIKDNIATG